MSREIRRVPLDYKHPVLLNPRWRQPRYYKPVHVYTGPKLFEDNEEFQSMLPYEYFASDLEDYEKWYESVSTRSGEDWEAAVKYYLSDSVTGSDGKEYCRSFELDVDDWMEEDESVRVKDEDHLQELLLSDKNFDNKRPEFDPDKYMPSFAEHDPDELGWCLYQTVSEGTPVTPVFATAEELADHLVEYGTLTDPPLRRESAESIVSTGYTAGSFFSVGGKLYSSTADADIFEGTAK